MTIYKAHGISGDRVPDLHLSITEEVPETSAPDDPDWFRTATVLYHQQGRELLELLKRTLPGGTMHALLVAMLEDKASVFRVRELPTEVT